MINYLLEKQIWYSVALLLVSLHLPHNTLIAQTTPAVKMEEKKKQKTVTLRPPADVKAVDNPNDKGEIINVSWKRSPDDFEPDKKSKQKKVGLVTGYAIERSSQNDPGWVRLGKVRFGNMTFEDENTKPGSKYFYRVIALGKKELQSQPATMTTFVVAKVQWFDTKKIWFGLMMLLVCGVVILFIFLARAGYALKIRKIAGLEVVNEAVGRATEMGRTCLFIPGIQDMNDIQTVAGLTVLGSVAKTAAEYDAEIEVPTCRSLVMTAAQETVEASFLSAGRPDTYNAEKIYYVTDEQFGYVAYLSGLMVRDEPAACFYMGAFFAESLILAETGNSIGAIQIAGTAMPSQLPFFVAACDYTLIGEEFFAASAYLSGEADQMGSLKGQDFGK
ncbi:hypothetical protein MNBD_PLANCTO02-1810, partial [hydrothermal vent metagenome]